MAAVYGLSNPLSKVAVVPIAQRQASAVSSVLGTSYQRFNQFWDLMGAVQVHGYVRAAMSVIGRSTIGAWWSLRPHEEFGDEGTERQRKRLMRFYLSMDRPWDNVKDFQGAPYKIMIGAMYLRYFGQAAYQIIRNAQGQAIGYDFLPGYIVPNVDENGYFQTPAFYQYPTKNAMKRVPFDIRDVIYITNPDWEGFPTGGTDMEAVSDFAIPLDLYLQVAAREYMKNRDKPEAFYILPSDVSDEAFNSFVSALEARYAGPANVGRNPTVIAGDLEIKELSKLPSDLPYQQARQDTRQELLAVSGVTGAKLGITDSLSSANLREARREFHETTMLPLFRLIESAFYDQLHVREFGVRGWMFKFNNPDFLTAVERATVHMRYKEMGAYTSNEIRDDLGKPRRKDKFGDRFADEKEEVKPPEQPTTDNPQGSPPEGREGQPDSPGQVGEPTLDDQDPPRGDQHDDVTDRVLSELQQWKSFATHRLKKGRALRLFETRSIPDYLRDAIQERLLECGTVQDVTAVFAEATSILEEEISNE